MLIRLFLLIAVVAITGVVFWIIGRTNRSQQPSASDANSLLYFWGPGCAACMAVKQNIADVVKETPWLRLRTSNIAESAEEAKRWNVLTVPTIILLDARGEVVFRSSGRLSGRQLHDAVSTLAGGENATQK